MLKFSPLIYKVDWIIELLVLYRVLDKARQGDSEINQYLRGHVHNIGPILQCVKTAHESLVAQKRRSSIPRAQGTLPIGPGETWILPAPVLALIGKWRILLGAYEL